MPAQELLAQASLGESYPSHEYSCAMYIAPINLDGLNNIEIHAPTQEEAEAIRSLVFEAIQHIHSLGESHGN